jgi:hypothetical protein
VSSQDEIVGNIPGTETSATLKGDAGARQVTLSVPAGRGISAFVEPGNDAYDSNAASDAEAIVYRRSSSHSAHTESLGTEDDEVDELLKEWTTIVR